MIRATARFAQRALFCVGVVGCAGVVGCGGDEPAAPPPARAVAAAPVETAAKSGGSAPGQERATLSLYTKVEDICRLAKIDRNGKPSLDSRGQPEYEPDPLCARHEFIEADFRPDMMGESNRDPFLSYVIDEVGRNAREHGAGEISVVTGDECDRADNVAAELSLRELTLVGIVTQGTLGYSLWSDVQRNGFRAERGDCISKDRVRVKEIGENVVLLEVLPPPGSAKLLPSVTEARQLHPEEVDLYEQLNFGVQRN